jgi:type IV pilus assembly protein PilY1
MRKVVLFLFLTAVVFTSPDQSQAEDAELFMTNIPPDALILLDKSGSMNLDPAGNWANYPNRRVDIAREILFDLLDNNHDGRIDEVDEKSLNIRLGYMRFWNSNDNDYVYGEYGDPWTGSIKILSGIGSPYSNIWSNVDHWAESDALGGTPLAASLEETKGYFERDVNPFDPAIACRQKFIILITDGEDTYACSGDGSENQPDMYRRRMLTVQRAKELSDAGIKVFVVAFSGTISESSKRTLNWTAKYGGTDNPLEMNSGDPSAYNFTRYGSACFTTDMKADPANYPLSGYAFLATDTSQLRKAMEAAAKYIQEKSYSFTAPSNPAFRITDKDVFYISSILPNDTPFWKGNIKAYRLNEDGSFPVDKDGNPLNSSLIWDASENLMATAPSSRKIYTYLGGGLKSFVYENLTNADLAVPSDWERQRIINHIRGIDAYDIDQDGNTTETREWKLGDIFHSNPVIVGEPSRFFEDVGFGGTEGFYQTNKDRKKVIIAGANDGMLHAFEAATGNEQWAFVPNSLLKNLKLMASAHTYYVDSSPKVADVWFYKSLTDVTKGPGEWKTVLICGLRKGGKAYFALDITDTLNPNYLWEFPKPADTATLGKVGQSWGEPAIGRVKVEVGSELYERWVAFIGGGFDDTNNTGKAFFVIDIKTGDIIKEFSGMEDMKYSFAAPPTAVDTNSDGYVDKIYIGDLGGQMWVFDVPFDEAKKKSNSKWTGKILFKARSSQAEKHPIYCQPAVVFDRYGNPWVYFGTGDREHPNDLLNPAESFYAVKDNRVGNYPRGETDLLDVTSLNTFSPTPKDGWYLRLEKSSQKSEKVLAKPVVFNKLVYFTTYAYAKTENPCSILGEARLYIVEYLSGAGALGVDDLSDLGRSPSQRSREIGVGVPSSPVIKVDSKGKASVTIGTTGGQIFSTQIFSPSKSKGILYWREVIP